MPFTEGSEMDVTITNPMDYPIELYSLEFDKQYLEEEDVLRWVKEYDKQHRLFLPPTEVGSTLPREIMEAYKKEQTVLAAGKSALELSDAERADGVLSATSVEQQGSQAVIPQIPSMAELLQARLAVAEGRSPHPSSTMLLPPGMGVTSTTSVFSHATLGSLCSQLDLTGFESSPVAACVARYLGFDISPEGIMAENRKGIAVIVNGPPSSGKTTQAQLLGEKYCAVVIDVDSLVIDAISTSSSSAGCRARQLCIESMNAPKVEDPVASKPPSGTKRAGKMGGTGAQSGKDIVSETVSPAPEPPKPFEVLPLEDTPHAVPTGSLLPITLPEELILEILSDRLQQSDCKRGVVVDGLVSQFAPEQAVLAKMILKAFNNRKHIFVVNIAMSVEEVQQRMEEIEQEKQRKQGASHTQRVNKRERRLS